MLRNVENGIANAIREDPVILSSGTVTVIVEDLADISYEISKALGELGVCVTVAVTAFDKRESLGPMVQGTLHVEITCYENPSLNRQDTSTPTAQAMGGNVDLAAEIVAVTSTGCLLTIFLMVLLMSRAGFI